MSTRRGNREGTVFQRGDGKGWRAEVRWVDRNGRSQRTSRTAPTQAEARRMLREIQKIARGDQSPGERTTTVEAYWERWRRGPLLSADRKASTVELYGIVMRQHVLPELGGIRLSRLTAGDVERMLASMIRHRDSRHGKAGEPVSGATRRTAFAVLRMMLDTAVRDGVVTQNVASTIARPKVDRQEADYLSPAELRTVLDALHGHRLEPLVLLLANTGLRIGEALALRWTDLDLDAPRLRVTGTVRRVGGRVERTAPKSQRSRRTLPLSPAVVEALWSWRKMQAAERLRAGTSWEGDQPWVFTTESGRLLDQRNAVRAYQRALVAAGVGVPARFHLFRHSAASAMLASGAVSVRTVSEVLGHSSTSITADTYGHVMDSAKAHALGVVDDVLSG